MPQFEITQDEWKVAHQYLDQAPDGTKLPFTIDYQYKDKLIARKNFKSALPSYQTFHSFLKHDGKIFGFQRKTFPDGSVNKAKFALDEAGGLFVVKIGKVEDHEFLHEEAILHDLKMSKGMAKRTDKSKSYIVMQALGINLERYLKGQNTALSLEHRLEIAIKISYQLYRLHEGHASFNHVPYAHGDLKPDNVTVDQSGDVHLIDYGLAEEYPKKCTNPKTNAHMYVACHDDEHVLTKEQYDVIALKRIIHLPDSLYGGYNRFIQPRDRSNDVLGLLTRDQAIFVSLLSAPELQQYQLNEYINTHAKKEEIPDYTKDHTTALMLCALLINARFNLKLDNAVIANDLVLMHALAGIHASGRISEVNHILSDKVSVNLIASLNAQNSLIDYDAYQRDPHLMQTIASASTLNMMRAIIHLKKIGLEKYWVRVLGSQIVSDGILAFGMKALPESLVKLIEDQSMRLARVILFLQQYQLEKYYELAMKSDELCEAIDKVKLQDCRVALIKLMRSAEFSVEGLIKVSHDLNMAKAINLLSLLYANDPKGFVRRAGDLLQSDDYVEAMLNMQQIELEDYQQKNILNDLAKCKALNILYRSEVKDKQIVSKIIYASKLANLIIKLNTLKIDSLYERILSDYNFSFEIESILEKEFHHQVTEPMITNDVYRKILTGIYSSASFDGFKVLLAAGLLDKVKDASDLRFETASFLQQKGFTNYLTWMVECPAISFHLNGLLDSENVSDRSYSLRFILQALPSEKRLAFVDELQNDIDVKACRENQSSWKGIKKAFADNKASFNELVYSKDELTDKETLKNIKARMTLTNWSSSNSKLQTNLGSKRCELPAALSAQANVFHEFAARKKTHAEAVKDIREIGCIMSKNAKGLFSTFKQSLFYKSELEKYLDNFETDEAFEKAFVKKS